MTTTLDSIKASQARLRAELLDPEKIRARQDAGALRSSDHEWRRSVFGRRTEQAPRPYVNRDGDVRRESRRKS